MCGRRLRSSRSSKRRARSITGNTEARCSQRCPILSATRTSVFAHAAAAVTSAAAGAACKRAESCVKRTASRHSSIAAVRRLRWSMANAFCCPRTCSTFRWKAQQTDQSGGRLTSPIVPNRQRLARDRWRGGTILPAPQLATADTFPGRVWRGRLGPEELGFHYRYLPRSPLGQAEALAHLRDVRPSSIVDYHFPLCHRPY